MELLMFDRFMYKFLGSIDDFFSFIEKGINKLYESNPIRKRKNGRNRTNI